MIKSSNKFFIVDTVIERYEKTLLENYNKILKHINNFINDSRVSEALQSKNPGLRLLYTPSRENDFYDSCGIDKDDFKDICKQSSAIPGEYLINQPVKQFYHLYFLLHSIACIYYRNNDLLIKTYYKGKKDYILPYKIIEFYFVVRMYSLQQLRIFKYKVNEDTMEYTINNLSARFDLATMPNIFSILEKYSDTNTKSTNYSWEHTSDEMMAFYTSKMNDRIKMFLKKIFVEYMKNHDANLSSKVQELDATNSEGKQFLLVADNISSTIDITSKKILNTFIQDKFINDKLLTIALKNSGNPSRTKTKMLIEKIRDSKDEVLLKELIIDVLSYWLISMKQNVNTLHSKQFITTCSAIYTISNTSDPYISKLKNVLEELINKYSSDIISTERKATLISFKKCIHIYMILYIASVN